MQRVEDWDNARYSITPPRAALDTRLTLIHFRLMAMLGRVNTAQGWCEMSQSAFAAALGYNRTSVVRAVKELVEWRYLEKRGQEEAGSARCHYRLLVDDPEPIELDEPTVVDVADDDAATQDVGTCSVGGDTSTCSVGGDTRVAREATHVSPNKDTALDQRSKITPPKAPSGGPSQNFRFEDRLLEQLRADGKHLDAVENLIAPLVASRKRLSIGKGSEAAKVLAEMAGRAHGIPTPALQAAAKRLVEQAGKVKPAEIAKAIDTARAAGCMVPIRRGTPQWHAWLQHFRSTKPREADVMSRFDFWQVRAEWPPQSQSTDGRPAA